MAGPPPGPPGPVRPSDLLTRRPTVPAGLVPPLPPPGPTVCRQCRGPTAEGYPECFCCAGLRRALGPLAPVTAVGACAVPGPFHTVLRGYKDAPSPGHRRRLSALLAELLGAFVAAHLAELEAAAGGALAGAVVVPSSRTPRRQAFEEVVELAWARQVPGRPALWTGTLVLGPGPSGGHRCRPREVTVRPPSRGRIAGRRILLLDDTLTTGATAQSAAAALVARGATVVVLVLGRVVRPGTVPAHARYWHQVVAQVRLGVPAPPLPQVGDPPAGRGAVPGPGAGSRS